MGISVYEEIAAAIQELAKLQNRTVSNIVEELIVKYINDKQMEVRKRVDARDHAAVEWKFDPKIGDTLCHRMMQTTPQGLPRSLLSICDEDNDMPPYRKVCEWLNDVDDDSKWEFIQKMNQTRKVRANMMADWFEEKISQIGPNNYKETKVVLDFLKYYLEKLNSDEWGAPAQQINVSRNENKRILFEVVSSPVIQEEIVEGEVVKEIEGVVNEYE